MTASPGKFAHRPTRNLDIPLAPLKARLVRDLPSKTPDSNLLARVRSEFLEMRGFSPTLMQAARLFHLATEECRQVLGTLVKDGFLSEEHDGRYRLSRHR